MKVKYFILLFIIFLLSCSIETCTEPQIQILQNDETFDKLLFFDIDTEPKSQVAGIDPETFEIKVRISGGSKWHICYSTTSSDGRLFINPALLQRAAPADDRIIVLNKYGKPIKTLIPASGVQVANMFIINDYLFIGDPGGAIGMMDIRNYHLYFYEVFFRQAGMLYMNDRLIWKNYVFLDGERNKLLKLNLNNPDERMIVSNYGTNPLGWYHFHIDGDRIFSVDSYTFDVRVYDLNSDNLIKEWNITNDINLPPGEGLYEVLCGVPVTIGNELLVYVKSDKSRYARMVVYDKNNYNFLYEVNLDDMILQNLILKYVRGTKLYFDTAAGVLIYDHSKKKCVRHITPEEVMGTR